jgi:hypothetical protein
LTWINIANMFLRASASPMKHWHDDINAIMVSRACDHGATRNEFSQMTNVDHFALFKPDDMIEPNFGVIERSPE